jgi:hypothetical protein
LQPGCPVLELGRSIVMIERSHGKSRHAWPRLVDVSPVDAAKQRTEGRDARGLFVKGNRAGAAGQQKSVIKRSFGSTVGDSKQARLARDIGVMYRELLRPLPFVDAQVRAQVATQAQCAVTGARCMSEAVEAGVETPAGQRLLELAAKLQQQACRAGVVAVDLSSKLHALQPKPRPDWWSDDPLPDDEAVEPDAVQDASDDAEPTLDAQGEPDASEGNLVPGGTAEGDT